MKVYFLDKYVKPQNKPLKHFTFYRTLATAYTTKIMHVDGILCTSSTVSPFGTLFLLIITSYKEEERN